MKAPSERVYLDFAATTPLHPEVRAAMEPWLAAGHGNPSSQHAEGRAAKAALDEARERVAQIAGAEFAEVIFTSGATEAANLALLGLALANQDPNRNRILLSSAEHQAVLGPIKLLKRLGYRVELLEVDREARLQPETLQAAIGADVLLVAAMETNNELGSRNHIPSLAQVARAYGAKLVVDAVQTFLAELAARTGEADLVILSAHKHGGPKGVGALIARAGIKLEPLIAGGEQERERRAGTENVAGIVGFGLAATLTHSPITGALQAFKAELPDAFVPSLTTETSDRILHGRVPGLDAETVLIRLDREGIAASSGAACSSGSVEPSHVLLAAGYSAMEAKEGLRFSFGPGLSPEKAKAAGQRVAAVIEALQTARASS